jgi:hypothetical protein
VTCTHDRVERVESRNPRMPLIRWLCVTCGQDFEATRHKFIEWATLKLEARSLRRELEGLEL